jgi:hypothetical protein
MDPHHLFVPDSSFSFGGLDISRLPADAACVGPFALAAVTRQK